MKSKLMAILMVTTLSLSASTDPMVAKYGLTKGTPQIESFNEMTFGPEGILFIADTRGAKIFAIDTQDKVESAIQIGFKVEDFESQVADRLGIAKDDIMVHDMVVNPISKNIYISISLKRQEWVSLSVGTPNRAAYSEMLLKVDINTKEISEVKLNDILFSEYEIMDAPARDAVRQRKQSMMDMKFRDNKLLVAGMSGEVFNSTFRTIDFPFTNASKSTSLEIFHYPHNNIETRAPINVFDTYQEGGETKLLAVFYCSPMVTFDLDKFHDGDKVRGETISEIWPGTSYPLDMVMYEYEGIEYALLSVSSKGLAQFKLDDIKNTPVNQDHLQALRREQRANWRDVGFATPKFGPKYKVFAGPVLQIDNYSDKHFMTLQRRENGNLDLLLRSMKDLDFFGVRPGVKDYIENHVKYNGIESGIRELKNVLEKGSTDYTINENELNRLGYGLLGESEITAAIEVFKLNVQMYPGSANVFDSLGEAYMENGDTTKAIINYEKSLELNPANDNAKEMLKKLKQ